MTTEVTPTLTPAAAAFYGYRTIAPPTPSRSSAPRRNAIILPHLFESAMALNVIEYDASCIVDALSRTNDKRRQSVDTLSSASSSFGGAPVDADDDSCRRLLAVWMTRLGDLPEFQPTYYFSTAITVSVQSETHQRHSCVYKHKLHVHMVYSSYKCIIYLITLYFCEHMIALVRFQRCYQSR